MNKEKELFLKYLRNQITAADYRAEIRAIGTGDITVPVEIADRIIARASRFPVRSLATIHQASSGGKDIPINTALPAVSWVPENGSFPTPDATFGSRHFGLNKVGGIGIVTEEMIGDSAFNIDTVIADVFGQAIGEKEDDAFINGTGTGQPRGLLLDAIPQAAGGATIAYADLLAMFAALPLRYHSSAAWLMNPKTLSAVIPLADAAGNPVFIPGGRALSPDASFIAGSIFGCPVYLSALPDVATGAKPVAFGNLSSYTIVDRTNSQVIQRLNELYSQTGAVGFLAYHRTDGALMDAAAVIALEF
ncbi:phage major capsid protein [Leadbettera azotonutricia]|uniref:Phage capsid family n=1 Tax=Leadbettera azotonutricia (strain ATCC BAA-888 / DSM 13862 / ZAS-9) TaxID=545695 RepID=F5YBI3_LEAAZ|nr:phage major capsid protein [Leadbettera azotonutricia]AEF83001.1 phage capsid family [Leadbettera azotonutricia ZAS-9]